MLLAHLDILLQIPYWSCIPPYTYIHNYRLYFYSPSSLNSYAGWLHTHQYLWSLKHMQYACMHKHGAVILQATTYHCIFEVLKCWSRPYIDRNSHLGYSHILGSSIGNSRDQNLDIHLYLCYKFLLWNRIYYRSNSLLAIIPYSQKSSLDKNFVRSTYPCITEIFHPWHVVKLDIGTIIM